MTSARRKTSVKSEVLRYKTIFENSPVAILEIDYSPLFALSRQLKKHTVTNIRQFLGEHSQIVKRTFRHIKIREANPAARFLLGAKNNGELLAGLNKTFSTSGLDALTEQFVSLLEGETRFSGEFRCRSLAGRYQDISLNVFVPESSRNSFSSVVVALQDITIWKRLERQLRKRAQLDGLTRLLNQNTIMQRLEEELIRAKRYGLSLSCLMIDLDHFKVINDKFGHQRGDQVLKRVASMLRNTVRKVDLVGRYGGDEFLIVMPETKPQNARYAALRIQKLFSSKIFRYHRIISFHIALSIGITGYPSKKVKDARDILSLADRAMYEAKKTGRNRIALV